MMLLQPASLNSALTPTPPRQPLPPSRGKSSSTFPAFAVSTKPDGSPEISRMASMPSSSHHHHHHKAHQPGDFVFSLVCLTVKQRASVQPSLYPATVVPPACVPLAESWLQASTWSSSKTHCYSVSVLALSLFCSGACAYTL